MLLTEHYLNTKKCECLDGEYNLPKGKDTD